MPEISVYVAGEERQHLSVDRFPFRIGRDKTAELTLASWRVARLHAQIECVGELRYRVRDLGSLQGTHLNGERVTSSQTLTSGDRLELGGYSLHWTDHECTSALTPAAAMGKVSSDLTHSDADHVTSAGVGQTRGVEMASLAGVSGPKTLTNRFVEQQKLLHARLIESMNLRRNDIAQLPAEQLRAEVEGKLRELLGPTDPMSAPDHERLVQSCLHEAIGLGPLQNLLGDDSVTEIMVNSAEEVFVERFGRLERAQTAFTSVQAMRDIIERIVTPLGRRIDEASPMVDARLPDGARVNIVLPPLALKGPAITIRKFSGAALDAADLIRLGSLDESMLEFLRQCIRARRNIAISGGTGSGKTTLLNVLARLIPPGERIVTIEDAAELQLPHVNLVALEARPANAEGRGEVVIRDLVRNALRMRPDRIVIGECRGGETLDMLQAMNTGHDGSMTTLHANSARDVSSRLETMALMAGIDIPIAALRQQIASAIQVIIHQARLADGSRRIVDISEVTGIDGGRLMMQSIFRMSTESAQRGRTAGISSPSVRFSPTGTVPQFYDDLNRTDNRPDLSIFSPPDRA